MKLVIQIPCFNEAETLPRVLADIPASLPGIEHIETLVIDDGSSDDTAGVARAQGATRVVRHRGNRGLARSFLTGIEVALEMGADIVVNTDGDHQYPGSSIAQLVAPIVQGEADLVIGDRKTAHDPKVPSRKKLFYGLGNFVVRSTTGVSVHDAPSGFRAMSREVALSVYLTNPFSYTLETLFEAAEQRFAIREVEIESNPATRKSRLFRGVGEYVRRSAGIIVQGYSMHNPLRAFGLLSVPFLLIGFVLGVRFLYYFIRDPDYSGHIQSLIAAAIASVVGVQILVFGMLGWLMRANRLLLQDIRRRVRSLELRGSAQSVQREAHGGAAQDEPARVHLEADQQHGARQRDRERR
ncbi:MAG TPA: glycosyltransferase family 2 protein [Polyangiales bacterium]|nr:glycosyltransferase family 2 protein [Polyangiales bacterium]